MQAALDAIAFMSKRIGRWRGEVDSVHGPSRDLLFDWLRAGDFHDVQGMPRASAHQQDEYTVAADVRFSAQNV
jgi:hypothetical protein